MKQLWALSLFLFVGILSSLSAFAVDGVVLINQAAVMAAGGFPYTISQPGSYRLSGSLVVPPNTDGIDINTDNVTIDLNGFSISCPVGTCKSGGSGVFTLNSNITVRNGVIVGFNGITPEFIVTNGIFLGGNNELVDHVQATNCNSAIGIGSGTITASVSSNNQEGIFMFGDGLVSGNTVSGNSFSGIEIFGNGSVTNNSITHNGSGLVLGINGFSGYGGNTFADNGTDVNSFGIAVSMHNNVCKAKAEAC